MSWKENIYIKKEEQPIVRLTKFGRGKSKKERVEIWERKADTAVTGNTSEEFIRD